MSGTATTNLPLSQQADDLVGNAGGTTVRVALSRIAALLSYLQGPAYKTSAELFADRNWPDGAIGQVFGDAAGQNGTYRKSGAAGSGSWTRTGDLAVSSLSAAQLAEKADVAELTGLRDEVRNGRVFAPSASTIASVTPPEGTDRMLLSSGGSVQYWVPVTAPADGQTSDVLQADQTGQWWSRRFDGRDLTTERADRIAAIGAVGVLPLVNVAGSSAITADLADASGITALPWLAQVELIPLQDSAGAVTLSVAGAGAWPVLRRNGSALHPGDLRAGVSHVLRRRGDRWYLVGLALSEVQALVDTLAAEVRAGRVYAPSAPSPSGITPPEGTDRIVTSAGQSYQYWTPASAPPDGVETDGLARDALGHWWLKIYDARDAVVIAEGAGPERYILARDTLGETLLGFAADGSWVAPTVFGGVLWPGDDLVVFQTSAGDPILAFRPDGTLIAKMEA